MTPATTSPRTLAAVLAIAAVAVQAAALRGPFQFDDWWAIVGNPDVHDLASWGRSLPGIRPLLKLVNTLNWLASPTPASFRAVNLALHAANAVLLATLLRAWLPRLAPACPRPDAAAFLAALLFALHPATTEVATYIGGRSIALATTLSLAALHAWSRADADDATPRDARRFAFAGATAFVAAVLARETALVAPLAWLLLAACAGRDARRASAPLRPLAWVVPPVLLAAWLTPGYHSFFGWSLQTRDVGAQLLGQLEAHLYLLHAPLPGRVLNIDPDVRVPAAFALRHALLLGAAAAVAAIAWRRRRSQPWIAFAVGWYLLHLAPANSLLPRFDLVNDRHLYAALPGPLLAVALGIAAVPARTTAAVLAGALALAAGARTVDRVGDYRSETALWEATIAASPRKARPWTNLGFARREAGDPAGARYALLCARRLDPTYAPAAWNLAATGPEGPIRAGPTCPTGP